MESPVDLLLLPLLLTFFGALVYGLTADAGVKRGRMKPSRWVGVGIVVLGLVAGFPAFWTMMDGFNRAALGQVGKKIVIAHYLAGLIPLLVLVGCIVFDVLARKRLVSRDF